MHRADTVDNPKPQLRTGYAHIAFSVGSKQRVDELSAAGFKLVSRPPVMATTRVASLPLKTT